jgi:putative oxidoreductase
MQHAKALDRYTPYALAALRIVTALIFMEHGTQKLFGFPAPPANGLPPALSLYWIGAVMEFGGGLLILIGAFTRPVAVLLAGVFTGPGALSVDGRRDKAVSQPALEH